MESKKPTVLIVDDDSLVLQTLCTMLEENDFEIVTARNGKEGLQALKNQKVDVVLSDINMPVMDGIEMTKHIRESDATCKIPVVLLTGRLDEEDKERTQDAGCNTFFVKPFRFADLVKAIKDLSHRR